MVQWVMDKIPLTIILPIHNEERNIQGCLESVLFADEIIVVDGESSDQSRVIASNYPVKIIDTMNDFAEGQRLKALAVAKHPWIFFIDADERVTDALREAITRTIREDDLKSAYYVRRKNVYRGQTIHLHDPDFQLRLFRSKEVVFPDKIHQKPDVHGKTGKLQGDLIHYFFTNVHDYLCRLNKYTDAASSYGKSDHRKKSAFFYIKSLFLRPWARFFQYYFIRRGFLDGYFGFFYSTASAYYEFASASKYLTRSDASDDAEIRKP